MLGFLTEKDRELVTLIVLDGFSITEAASALGARAGTARMPVLTGTSTPPQDPAV